MTNAELDALAKGRPLSALTKQEKAWLRRSECGWCGARGTASQCQAMYTDDPCDMDVQRGIWLASYKPRNHLRAQEGSAGGEG